MKKIHSAHIVAIAFGVIMILGIIGFFSVNSFLKPIYANMRNWDSGKTVAQNLSAIEKSIENTINENVGFRTSFIQVNGLAQKLMGKRVVPDADVNSTVVKLNNDYLVFIEQQATDDSLQDKTNSVLELKNYLESKGAELLYVQAPTKINEHNQQLPSGVNDYSTENCERFVAMLDSAGVDTLNLIEKLREENVDWYSMFFKTDHHWTNEAGFWAYTELASILGENYGFEIGQSHLDPDSYTKKTYESVFLGSLGKRTGSMYSGLDDISLMIPKFETSFEYSCPIKNTYRSGKFEDSLLFDKQSITGHIFKDFCYNASLGGDFGYMKISNNLNPNGKKVMIIKDSFANPVATHLSLDVAQLEIVDLRMLAAENSKTVKDCIDESNPDIVIILYSSQQLFKTETFEFGV